MKINDDVWCKFIVICIISSRKILNIIDGSQKQEKYKYPQIKHSIRMNVLFEWKIFFIEIFCPINNLKKIKCRFSIKNRFFS